MFKNAIHSTLNSMGYALYRTNHFDIRDPIATLGYEGEGEIRAAIARVRDRTMVSYAALVSLWAQIKFVEESGMPGALVECGVWKGGAAGLMALGNMANGASRRPLHLFDAFTDICEPDPEKDGERAIREAEEWAGRSRETLSGAMVPMEGQYAHLGGPGDEVAVRALIADELGYGHDNVIIHKGWFQDTLPNADTGEIAILRLDGDWYASTKVCLDHLYDRVVPGGFVVIDDYGCYEGCRRAVDEFLAARGACFLNFVSTDVRYWIKPQSHMI